MYKAVFQNSKIALIFAVVTILSAVSMVGTSEDSGLLPRVVSLVSNSRSHDSAAEVQEGPAPAKPKSVFGEYAPDASGGQGQGSTPVGGAPASGSEQGFNPMTAPMAPGAVVSNNGVASGGSEIPQSEMELPSQ